MTARRLHLAASIVGTGTSPSSARWPGTRWDRFARWDHYLHAARTARRGVLDAVFVSDHPAHQRDAHRAPGHVFDPIALFSAIAGAVPDIGFVLTASTSYNAPYNLARRVASLDAISGGRTILNLVTSFNPDIAANFGAAALPSREERYRRAHEFVEVLTRLWDSWELGADEPPPGPLWHADPIDHHGEFYDVRGPLTVPVGPQRRPVLAQAGASGPGLDLAARHAEIVYAALLGEHAARAFRAELDQRAVAQGRDPRDLRVLPGVNVVVGDTAAEARARHLAFQGVRDEEELVARTFAQLRTTGRPAIPTRLDPDRVLDPAWFEPDPTRDAPVGFARALQDLVATEGLTARELVTRHGDPGGHRLVVGTPRQVADALTGWWADGVVDGYVVHLPLLPGDLERFVDQVVPLLQADGVAARDYDEAGVTIRDRFGLPVPSSSTTTSTTRVPPTVTSPTVTSIAGSSTPPAVSATV